MLSATRISLAALAAAVFGIGVAANALSHTSGDLASVAAVKVAVPQLLVRDMMSVAVGVDTPNQVTAILARVYTPDALDDQVASTLDGISAIQDSPDRNRPVTAAFTVIRWDRVRVHGQSADVRVFGVDDEQTTARGRMRVGEHVHLLLRRVAGRWLIERRVADTTI